MGRHPVDRIRNALGASRSSQTRVHSSRLTYGTVLLSMDVSSGNDLDLDVSAEAGHKSDDPLLQSLLHQRRAKAVELLPASRCDRNIHGGTSHITRAHSLCKLIYDAEQSSVESTPHVIDIP